MEILLFVGIVVISVYLGINFHLQNEVHKLLFGLPPLKWMTLEEAIALGFSKTSCEVILPTFHKAGLLEVRRKENLSETDLERIRVFGFEADTVQHHEFRTNFTKRVRRKMKKVFKPFLKPAWA